MRESVLGKTTRCAEDEGEAASYLCSCKAARAAPNRRRLQHNATSWDNGCQKPPLLTPFLTPVAPRRARDRVPSILALGPFFTRLRFHAARKRASHPLPSPFHIPVVTKPQVTAPKIALLHFCTSGSEMPLTEEPGLYKRPCPRSPLYNRRRRRPVRHKT
jgi:hypothetical protein